jgi:hypothetical protein
MFAADPSTSLRSRLIFLEKRGGEKRTRKFFFLDPLFLTGSCLSLKPQHFVLKPQHFDLKPDFFKKMTIQKGENFFSPTYLTKTKQTTPSNHSPSMLFTCHRTLAPFSESQNTKPACSISTEECYFCYFQESAKTKTDEKNKLYTLAELAYAAIFRGLQDDPSADVKGYPNYEEEFLFPWTQKLEDDIFKYKNLLVLYGKVDPAYASRTTADISMHEAVVFSKRMAIKVQKLEDLFCSLDKDRRRQRRKTIRDKIPCSVSGPALLRDQKAREKRHNHGDYSSEWGLMEILMLKKDPHTSASLHPIYDSLVDDVPHHPEISEESDLLDSDSNTWNIDNV